MDGETGLDCVTVGQPDSVSLWALVDTGWMGIDKSRSVTGWLKDSTVLKRIDKIRIKKYIVLSEYVFIALGNKMQEFTLIEFKRNLL